MTAPKPLSQVVTPKNLRLPLAALLALTILTPTTAPAAELPVVSKWERFEVALKSSVRYTNAVQQAELEATFVSPLGETNRVPGFWDGGKTWRVRFAPDMPGRWVYFTSCSDTANNGLHQRSGEFVCTAATGQTRFGEHGPLRVARNRRHLEHADRSPFLWLGDAAWDAPCRAELKDLEFYASERAKQKFNVVQWKFTPTAGKKPKAPFTGHERISLDVDYWKQLDAKVDTLNRAGLLSALAPLWEIGPEADQVLPEDQAAALLRYAVARWGANDVAWIVAFEADRTGRQAARWQRIGRAVFGNITHAPVILLPGETHWVADEFRNETWVDAFGFATTQVTNEDELQWLLTGPLTLERRKLPARPLIALSPPAEVTAKSESVPGLDADQVRHLLWWSLLVTTPAGVSYRADDVATWNPHMEKLPNGDKTPPAWKQALSLPGAKNLAPLSEAFNSIAFDRLRPFSLAVVNQAGRRSPLRYIAAEGTEARDLTVLYVPQERTVEVALGAIPRMPTTTWFNPRTGQSRPAIGTFGPNACQFAAPGAGDWLLILKAGK
jgi:hypothetical protein